MVMFKFHDACHGTSEKKNIYIEFFSSYRNKNQFEHLYKWINYSLLWQLNGSIIIVGKQQNDLLKKRKNIVYIYMIMSKDIIK